MSSWNVLKTKWTDYKRGIALKTVLIIACLLAGYYYDLAGVLLILNSYILYKVMSDKRKNKFKRWIVQAVTTNIFILFLYFLNKVLGLVSAVLAFLIVTLVLAGYLLYKQRAQYMEAVRTIETMLFGAPLYKKIKRGKK